MIQNVFSWYYYLEFRKENHYCPFVFYDTKVKKRGVSNAQYTNLTVVNFSMILYDFILVCWPKKEWEGLDRLIEREKVPKDINFVKSLGTFFNPGFASTLLNLVALIDI